MTVRKKIFWITALIIIAAITIVLCVGYFNARNTDYNGTLVKIGTKLCSTLGDL